MPFIISPELFIILIVWSIDDNPLGGIWCCLLNTWELVRHCGAAAGQPLPMFHPSKTYNDEDDEVDDDGGDGSGDDDQRHSCGGLLRLVDNLTQKPETM